MVLDVGKSIVEGLWSGISSMASWVTDKVKGFASGIVDGIKGFLGIHSPSTVFAEIGDNMALGVGVGFTDSMKGVSEDIQGAIPTNLDGPEVSIDDPDVPNPKTPPDVTYGVYPNVESYELPGNEAAASITGNAAAIGEAVEDVVYKVSPIIEDIKTPPVSDLTYAVSPLVEDFNPPGYDKYVEPDNSDDGDPEPDGDGDGNGLRGGPTGGDGGGFTFAPTVPIQITVEGNADREALEELRAQLEAEFEAKMRELFEEFREEEIQRAALKNQLAF